MAYLGSRVKAKESELQSQPVRQSKTQSIPRVRHCSCSSHLRASGASPEAPSMQDRVLYLLLPPVE